MMRTRTYLSPTSPVKQHRLLLLEIFKHDRLEAQGRRVGMSHSTMVAGSPSVPALPSRPPSWASSWQGSPRTSRESSTVSRPADSLSERRPQRDSNPALLRPSGVPTALVELPCPQTPAADVAELVDVAELAIPSEPSCCPPRTAGWPSPAEPSAPAPEMSPEVARSLLGAEQLSRRATSLGLSGSPALRCACGSPCARPSASHRHRQATAPAARHPTG